MTRPPRPLSDEDRILWSLVARSTKPMHPRRLVPESVEPVRTVDKPVKPPEPISTGTKPKGSVMPAYIPPVSKPRAPTHLDQPTLDRLANGRLPIEARVDLHGMTQDEAHMLLYAFVSRAYARGARYVLVITGKGSSSGGDGVLKRSVPGWLATPLFRQFVSSHDPAARGHGGSGALYVRLKRQASS